MQGLHNYESGREDGFGGMMMRDDWLGGLRLGLITGALAVIGVEALFAVIWAAVVIGRGIIQIVR